MRVCWLERREQGGRGLVTTGKEVSPQGPLLVSLCGRVLLPFVEHFRKPGRPLFFKKPGAGRLGPELGWQLCVDRWSNPASTAPLHLSPRAPSKFSTVTVGLLVLRLVSILEKLTLGQGSWQVFIWG